MSIENNKAALRRLYEEAFNKGNLDVVDEIISPKWVYHGAEGMEFKGPGGFKQFLTIYRTAFPDFKGKVQDLIGEGDKVVTVATVEGTFKGTLMGIPATGKHFTNTVVSVSRFENGKEAEVLETMDMFAMFQQLGVIPPMGPPKQ